MAAPVRGWYNHNRSWYGGMAPRMDNATQEFMVGLYDPEEGLEFEFRIAWIDLGREVAPHLEMFPEAWRVLTDPAWQDFVQFLAANGDKCLSDVEFEEALRHMGFVDLTKETRP